MKRIYVYIILLFGCGFISCSSEEDAGFKFSGDNAGALTIRGLTINGDIPWVITKAADFSMLDPSRFIIEIYKEGNTEPYKKYDTLEQLKQEGSALELPVGDYIIKAFSYVPKPVLRDKPYFVGESAFSIEEKEVTDVFVECKYQSLGVEIQLTEAFLSFFKDDYVVTVYQYQENGSNDISAVFSKKNPEMIYFNQDCLYLKIVVDCTSKDNIKYPSFVYYLNKDGKDPEFGNDGPHRGEFFIFTIDSDKVVSKSMVAR